MGVVGEAGGRNLGLVGELQAWEAQRGSRGVRCCGPADASIRRSAPALQMQTYGDPPAEIVEEMTGGAGPELNAALAAADQGGVSDAPALEELERELGQNCKMQ
jgi:hypothetical protein